MAEKATQMAKAQPAQTPAPAQPRGVSRFRSSPFLALERELEALFDDFRRGFRWPGLLSAAGPLGHERIPAFDVYEDGDDVVVTAELPGMSKEDIEVNLTDSTLTVKGEKKRQQESKDENYAHSERSFGMISRTVELPFEVKADQAKASLKDGVLEVRIPKSDAAKQRSRKIQVQ
jgi:HSP20 family protein